MTHPTSLPRVLLKAGLSFNKTLLALDTEREDVRAAREEWKARHQPRMREAVHRLVFLYDTSTTTKMTWLCGRARRGVRLKAAAPFGHWATQTFIAGLRCDGLVAPWVVNQPMNREIFDTYVETQLAPTLRPADVVILDNPQATRRLVLFLPPYNPDLNPIELAFAKLQPHLWRIGTRTIEAFWRAIGDLHPLLRARVRKLSQHAPD